MSDRSPAALYDAPIETTDVPTEVVAATAEQRSSSTPVDGVGIIFFDPATTSPYLVFASEGLAALVGLRAAELLGHDPAMLFIGDGGVPVDAIRHALFATRDARSPGGNESVDGRILEAATSASASHTRGGISGLDAGFVEPDLTARFVATQTLQHRTGESVLVHATYAAVPSMTLSAPYVLAQFRDLRQEAAEGLLADQPSVVDSLHRGNDLGRLCHQLCSEVEGELGDGSQCWLAIADPAGELEPVVTGTTPFDVVGSVIRVVAGSAATPTKRVVSLQGLPTELASRLRSGHIRSLWYVPLLSPKGESGRDVMRDVMRGAIVVATARKTPDRAITDRLDRLAMIATTAIEQSTVEAGLVHRSLHDPLTRLPNRALIVDRLSQAMARLERDGIFLSVLLVDIDRFKTVNDIRGAEVGDRVLLEVASRLLTVVRLGDTVGRISSDQYLIMCASGTGDLDPTAVARRVLRSLAEPIVLDGVGQGGPVEPLRITASIGVVVVEEPDLSPAEIIGNAESALRQATAAGRGQFVVFEEDIRQDVLQRHEIEQALHRAVAEDELVVQYQPLFEIRTGFMVGAEALVRWARPGHELQQPGAFIGIAEESDLIVSIGSWVIDKVCADLSRWPRSNGRSPVVTINLAARQLGVDTLVPTVISALRRNSLHPRHLGFEITESMQIPDLRAADVNLNRLSELGCRIAIDDFGIGHATLDYLRRFSMAAALKLDRSFVAGLGTSREDTAIVNASIALASSLSLQVIAEGVENTEQLEALHELGCRYAQGFLLARPMSIDDALRMWQRARLYGGIDDLG